MRWIRRLTPRMLARAAATRYMPPELNREGRRVVTVRLLEASAVDMHALGKTLEHLLCGAEPSWRLRALAKCRIACGCARPRTLLAPSDLSDEARAFIEALTDEQPSKRPSAADAKCSAFMRAAELSTTS